ncbi:hypothetical protein PIB30_025205 [Stylosanthes scabra]|uniref:Reverse transcriptase zinc-binding domain-containing protein n=1 Tax=Stylosanthes scabra TaxID=79078 RepID=A0ABU6Q9K2_9FABA|nr:hypothetical protein [Stylosanthes scabra]
MAATGRMWGQPMMKHTFDSLWCGLVPPRIEMMAWFALTGGLNTREVLLRRGVIGQGEEKCILCNEEMETWMVVKVKVPKVHDREEARRVMQKPMWWNCCYFGSNENKYIVGGYMSNERGNTTCWMGDEIRNVFVGEAHLYGLENALQFMLEEANMENEEITMASTRKDIVQ